MDQDQRGHFGGFAKQQQRQQHLSLTTCNFQSAVLALRRRLRPIDDNSCIRTNAIDSFPDRTLRSFSSRQCHRNHQRRTIAR